MKISFIIPFYYKWQNFSNCRANYEYLQIEGHEVDIFSNKELAGKNVDWNGYDLIMLHGSGAVLPEEEYAKVKVPIISFGWSDPNLFNEVHFDQGDIYCTNDMSLANCTDEKPVIFYNTACDKRHHKDLNLRKETDIIVYGAGNHKFVKTRNETVNALRKLGFNIKVFGRGWDTHPDTYGFIEGEQLGQEICKAHLLLDLSDEVTSWPHRIFECSARGTPALTMDRPDTQMMFEEGEILYYKDYDDMVDELNFWINEHKYNLRNIGLKAQARCYKDHDISVRIKELLNIMEQL